MTRRADTLVQVLLPPDVAQWVRSRALREGLQVSAWLRQLIVRERMRLVVDARWCDPAERRSPAELFADGTDPPFALERVSVLPGDRIEFRWLTHGGKPLRDTDLLREYSNISSHLYAGRFALRGDPRPWRVIHAMADASDDNVVIFTLEPDRPGPHMPSARAARQSHR